MWTYSVADGSLYAPKTGARIAFGYSGREKGLNNSCYENVHCIGPIPRGQWIIGKFFDDAEKGPVVCHLIIGPASDVYGRDGFMIHGDNSAHNCSASEGCIILPRFAREAIRDSGDSQLMVI